MLQRSPFFTKNTYLYVIITIIAAFTAIAPAAADSLINESVTGAALKGVKHPKPQKYPNKDFPNRRIKPQEKIKPVGKLKLFFITDNCLIIAGDYNRFICDRITKECGSFLLKLDNKEISVPDWSYKFHYNFAFNEVVNDYRPKIKNNFENPDYFAITDKSTREQINIGKSGYWINAIGQMRVPRIKNGDELLVSGAAVAHFAYLKLSQPLQDGNQYLITTKNGEKLSFKYDEKVNISRVIKVNQLGYAPDAGWKYAYLGSWLADLGPLNLSEWNGKKFYIIDNVSGENIFTGIIKKRADEQYHKGIPLNGEIVYEMDFSDFTTEGTYHIYIPGIGRSWDFSISNNAIGEAFFIHARGLYHQRCGIAKEKPFTNWTMGTCHKETRQGGFPPNDKHYRKEGKTGEYFTDKFKNPVTPKPFSVVKETATEKILPNVWGGWHDAADYDRRTYHFAIVRDLLSAYLMFPEKFPDGQLNIPESGNKIPDIIDEAAWGVDVWRRAQNKNGGVGCWIEAVSHPKNSNPSTDTQKYYLALPTQESTIDYSGSAAMLALAYKKCGAQKKSTLFLKSAEKAFEFATTPEYSAKTTFTIPKKIGYRKKIIYKEPKDLDKSALFKAALNLYLLTGDNKYKLYLTKEYFNAVIKIINYPKDPFYITELLTNKDIFPEFYKQLKQFIIKKADERLKWQQSLAYRNLNWPIGHGYFRYMSWGAALPFHKGKYFISAYYLTKDKKYRNAALLLNDWMCGTNPMGRTMTTGLGKVAPVNLLSLTSYSDGIAEPIPGITLYTFTGRTNYNAAKYSFGLNTAPREDHGWKGSDICLLPKSLTNNKSQKCKNIRGLIDKMYPLWRRFCNIEGLNVPQNEFTVWETISPNAACVGCLLPDNWMPGKNLLNRKPVENKNEMEGYIFLP
jgi:endoglucanase